MGNRHVGTQGLSSIGAITWSPDGTRLAVIGSDDDEIGAAWQGSIFILELTSPPRRLTDDSIKPVAGFAPVTPAPELRWTEDGRIIFLADSRGESYLFYSTYRDQVYESLGFEGDQYAVQGRKEVSPARGELSRVVGGEGAQFSTVTTDERAESAVVLSAFPTSAGDLHLIDMAEGSLRQLTAYNQEYFTEHPAACLEKFTLVRSGMEIECRLLLPPDFDASRKYPMVVDIHGGPHGAFYDAFNAVQQVLATAGYIVLCVNPRGSSTYGAEFARRCCVTGVERTIWRSWLGSRKCALGPMWTHPAWGCTATAMVDL